MAKVRLVGAFCLYVAAFQLSVWAEKAMPEKSCFLQGNIVEISARLTAGIALCLLALLLNHRAEKSLARKRRDSREEIIVVFFNAGGVVVNRAGILLLFRQLKSKSI